MLGDEEVKTVNFGRICNPVGFDFLGFWDTESFKWQNGRITCTFLHLLEGVKA